MSPRISPHLPTSPHISLNLPHSEAREPWRPSSRRLGSVSEVSRKCLGSVSSRRVGTAGRLARGGLPYLRKYSRNEVIDSQVDLRAEGGAAVRGGGAGGASSGISPHLLPISPHLPPSLPISPHLSPHLPTSPHLSPHLPPGANAAVFNAVALEVRGRYGGDMGEIWEICAAGELLTTH